MLLRGLLAVSVLIAAFAVTTWVLEPPGGPASESSLATKEVASLATKDAPLVGQAALPVPPPFAAPVSPPPVASPPFNGSLFDPRPSLPQVQAAAPAAEAAAPTAPRPKPFRCARAVPLSPDLLTTVQLARVKAALNLTPEQERHWRPLEAALAGIARELDAQRAGNGARGPVLDPARSQQLYFTAGPLVTSLREEQKREARNLACSLGLATVAELI